MDNFFRKILIGTFFIFFLTIFLGYLSAPFLPGEVLGTLKQAFAPFFELTPWELVFAIFIHNTLRVLLVILLGIIVGIAPFIFLVANGFLIGIVVYEVAILKGLGITILALIPHGIIEIPAVILGISLGFQTGFEMIKWLLGKKSQIKISLKISLKTFLKLIVPALFLASLIEVFLTPRIL
jgi:stage II sporulation protein M